METLIEQLRNELKISEEEAIKIMKTIAEFVENQHPLLKDLTHNILEKELEKTKNV